MPRTGVQYLGGDEPAFIKQFKQRIGHKDGPDVDTKRQIPRHDEDDDSDSGNEREDEKPMVVVLKSGDLTADEVKDVEKEREEGPARLDEKIVFRKPTKRSNAETEVVKDSAKESGSDPSPDGSKKKKDSSKKHSSAKKNKNSNLLSFGDEDEEDL